MTTQKDTSEKGFQQLIVNALVNDHGYIESHSNTFDKEFCINKIQLFDFLSKSQKTGYDYIQQKGERSFLVRLDKAIKDKGIIEVMRKGIKHVDKTIHLFYPQPHSVFNTKDQTKYEANIFAVTQELVYTDQHKNRLDLTISLNGFPLLTMELKNAFTHQAVENAINQYKKDRNPKDKIFNLGRCMVHFAVDTSQVYMTGALAGANTVFFPFNKGLNEGGPHPPFGAGNPIKDKKIKTAYLWEDILSKASLANIVEKFATLITEKDKKTGKEKRIQIFPRYHQLTVVRDLLKDVKNKGIGQRYLIQHSAGSGKSNSITWLAHQLIGLTDKDNTAPLFDSVIVVTDRRVLDKQIRNNIKAFAQVKRIVEAITGEAKHIKVLDPSEDSFSKTTHMRLALANNKKIITCTVQTFPYVLKTVQDMATKKVAILIDEAHSSQSGDAAASMNALFADIDINKIEKDEDGKISTEDLLNHLIEGRKMLKNASYFAFTATPKNKTLETFGVPNPYRDEHGEEHFRYLPFHTYSMKQAIEEEFILDVLAHYTTRKSYYRIKQSGISVDEAEQFDVLEANKKIRSYVEGHEVAINDKARIMIDHFYKHVRQRIQGKAKAMVVCKSIESAMKYKEIFDHYLKELNSPFKTIVAFSGKKKHWETGEELTEEKMNHFGDNNNDIPEQFEKDEYRFLIVANKYQTGFDQPLLHTMYVDKQLSGIQAVQTLSRLNRAKKPHKRETFVLDFYNETSDIQAAFKDYYTTTILSQETDVNKLNDLQDELESVQIFDQEDAENYFKLFYNEAIDRSALDNFIDTIQRNFSEDLIKEQQIAFKGNAKSFVRTYSYLSRIVDFKNEYWEQLWLFLKYLVPHLKIENDEVEENVLALIDMDTYRSNIMEDGFAIRLEGEPGYVSPIPVGGGGGETVPVLGSLEHIIKSFNDRFGDVNWGDGINAEDVQDILVKEIPEKLENNLEGMASILNSDKVNAKEETRNLVREIMQNMMFSNTAVYKKFVDDADFRNRYQEFIFDMVWTKGKDEPRK